MQTKNEKPKYLTVTSILSIILSVGVFLSSSTDLIAYLLKSYFKVSSTNEGFGFILSQVNNYNLFSGLFGLVGSILLFVGALYVLGLAKTASKFVSIGAILLIIANVFEIINIWTSIPKTGLDGFSLSTVAFNLGSQVLDIAMYVFFVVLFTREKVLNRLNS